MTAQPHLLAHIEPPAGEQPIQLTELKVEAEITGMYAQTSQTMVFYNPNQRPLEGSLVFPMPEGAVVCGYALDVQGRMVDGVVVAKEEARRILETEIRQGVDPGLVEQVAGNLYRTRVYPLPPQATRRVRITYVSELTSQGAGAHYHLPLGHGEHLQSVQVRLTVNQTPVTPVLQGWAGQQMVQRDQCWISEGELSGQQDHDFHLTLPDLPDLFTQVERTDENEVFFCVSARQQIQQQRDWRPSSLGVVWDASGSRLDHSKELELLRLLSEVWPNARGQLIVLREDAEPPRPFESMASLVAILEQTPCDGASGLAQLEMQAEVEAWLLFSDGLDTVCPGLPKTPLQPVFTVTSQAAHNSNLLQLLAEASQGRFFNLNRWSVTDALACLTCIQQVSPNLECQGGQQLHRSPSQGRLQLLGRLTAESQQALVTTGSLEAVRLEMSQARPGNLLAKAWAGRELAATQARNGGPQESLELARRYGLVNEGASLLVLESLEQYLKYEVCPPKSDPKLRQDYLRHLKDRHSEDVRQRRSRLETVCHLWAERVKWWETDFTAQRESARSKKRTAPPQDLEARGGGFAGAVPPPPACAAAMAPPSPAPAARMMMMAAAPMLDALQEMCAPADEPEAPKGGAEQAPSVGSITIQAWDPQTPYLRALRESSPQQAYETYLRLRPQYASSPSFYLDCADYFMTHHQSELGLRVLSNLLELALDDPALLRIYAWRLQQAGRLDQAVAILERVLPMRADEPQSHRDLGLALSDRWERDGDPQDAYRAAELLYEVVQREWDRFPEIEVIALMELNRLLHKASAAGVVLPEVDQRLVKNLDLDLRISMSWDADLTDVDLHVWEPCGDHAYYGSPRSPQGGLVSLDFRQGYGPEEYVLRKAMAGDYEIKAHYYGSHQQSLMGPCTVLVSVFSDYARPQEKRQLLTLRLDKPSNEVSVGKITVQVPTPGF